MTNWNNNIVLVIHGFESDTRNLYYKHGVIKPTRRRFGRFNRGCVVHHCMDQEVENHA